MAGGQKEYGQQCTSEKTKRPSKLYFIHNQLVINIFEVIFQMAKVTYLCES
jgi:hypothetical protein